MFNLVDFCQGAQVDSRRIHAFLFVALFRLYDLFTYVLKVLLVNIASLQTVQEYNCASNCTDIFHT